MVVTSGNFPEFLFLLETSTFITVNKCQLLSLKSEAYFITSQENAKKSKLVWLFNNCPKALLQENHYSLEVLYEDVIIYHTAIQKT